MFEENEMDLVWRALAFSAHQHRDQRRKDTHQSPYINHPIEAAELLWRVGGVRDAVTLCAALLHDTVEDTGATPEELASLFGSEVSAVVLEVTDDKSLPKDERKRRQVEHAPSLSARAALVKLADKICNVRDVGRCPPPAWPLQRRLDYLDWASAVVQGIETENLALKELFETVVQESRQRLVEGG